MEKSSKIILIILTIFILGPLIFVGACFPIGLIGLGTLGNSNVIYLAIVAGLIIAVFVIVKIIKKINQD
jgi:hypothetical protein